MVARGEVMLSQQLDARKLTGPQKAAVFLLMMGEEFASEMFKKMEEDEIGQIASEMSEIEHVPPDVIRKVMKEFVGKIESNQMVVQGETFLKTLIQLGLDKERAGTIHKELEKGRRYSPFNYLEGMDVDPLVGFIRGEHPQTIALILAHVSPPKAAEILVGLPPEIQASVAMRIADITKVPTETVRELDLALEKEVFSLGTSSKAKKVGGVNALADILNEVDRETEQNVMTAIEEEKADVAEEIKQLMYVFEDLTKLDDRGLREILKQIETSQLGLALKTASEEMKERIFKNLSERAGDMLREDMEIMGPVRLVEVEKAQQNMTRIARDLEAAGRIVIRKGKEDILV
jgi:flagellar motor switch protein FliG